MFKDCAVNNNYPGASRAGDLSSLSGQRGAALIVGLILMLVMTVLGVSGMTMSIFGLTMASNAQTQQTVFQAAESGIDILIEQRNFPTTGPINALANPGGGAYNLNANMQFQVTTPVPGAAFSMGVGPGSVQAFHFDIQSTGTGPQNASALHNQSVYVVGPGGT